MCYHIFAFIAGFVLDLLIGDPHFIPHPVRLIGSLISFLDKRLNCDAGYNISEKKLNLIKYKRGMLLAFTVIFATFAISVIIIVAALKKLNAAQQNQNSDRCARNPSA